jgi:hypothetical protein
MSHRALREQPETIRGHMFIRLKSGRLLSFWNTMDAAKEADTDMTSGEA